MSLNNVVLETNKCHYSVVMKIPLKFLLPDNQQNLTVIQTTTFFRPRDWIFFTFPPFW